jgi:hypothetical protein
MTKGQACELWNDARFVSLSADADGEPFGSLSGFGGATQFICRNARLNLTAHDEEDRIDAAEFLRCWADAIDGGR